MICGNPACGREWKLARAHVIDVERTSEGCRVLIQCPQCGHVESVFRPDIGECNGD